MVKHIVIIIFWLVLTNTYSQTLSWTKKTGGTGEDQGKNIWIDKAGNIYLTGYFSGTVDFDPGPSVLNLTASGMRDVFFSKYDPLGNLLWAKRLGGPQDDEGKGICVDDSGFVYITGTFSYVGDFDPGPSSYNLTSAGGVDAFVARYDPSGNYKFALRFGSSNNEIVAGLVLDKTSDIIVAGDFWTTVDFDPSTNYAYMTSNGNQDIFLASYNKFGAYKWSKKIGTIGSEFAYEITQDNSSNIYIAGEFSSGLDMDPGPSTSTLAANGGYDVYFAKYDSLGNYYWAKNLGGNIYDDYMGGISLDPKGNIYVSGYFQGTGDFDPGPGTYNLTTAVSTTDNSFFGKYRSNGDLVWARSLPSNSENRSTTLIADTSLNVYVSGYYQTSPVDLDAGPGTYTISWLGGWDMYMVKYDSTGIFQGGGRMASTTDDIPCKIVRGPGNSVFLTGSFGTTCDMDPLTPTVNLVGSGITDMFLSKFSSGGCLTAPSQPGSISGNSLACQGTATTFSVAYDPSASSYIWSLPAGWSATTTGNIISSVPGNTGVISVAATNSCGTSASSFFTVTVNPSPTITVNSGSICAGQTFTITPSGAISYTVGSGNAIVSPTVTTSYSVAGTNTFGCVSNTVMSNVTVQPLPTVTAVSSNTLICVGQTVTISPSGASSYTLFPGPISGSVFIVTPTVSSTYTVSGSSSFNCQNSGTIDITVNPVPSVSISTSSVLICSGQSVTLTAMGAGAYSYSWNTASAASSIVVTPSITTTYSVTGTNSSGCSYLCSYTQSVSLCTSVENLVSVPNAISIFPNPSNGEFMIISSADIDLVIINELGQLVKTIELNTTNNHRSRINDLGSGMYFIINRKEGPPVKEKIVISN